MNDKDYIYFDSSATTMPYAEVMKSFEKISIDYFANPSSNHGLGYRSSEILEKARRQIAKYLDCQADEVIFTSGATEGNNLAIRGVCQHCQSWAKRIITTKAEHPSVLNLFEAIEKTGYEVIYLDYDKEGRLNLEQLRNSLNDKTCLVSIMAVNNETGYIFPIEEAYDIIHKNSKALLHVDATQAICKMPLNSQAYDLMSFSGHKVGGLKGSGVLVKKKNVFIDEQIIGGSQENGLRAGTSFMGLDCSLATALRLSFSTMESRSVQAKKITDYLRTKLSEIKEVVITSPLDASPFILNFSLLEHKGSVIAEALSNHHVYVSTTSACSSREAGISYVLKGAGWDDEIASNSIRLSFSGTETIDQAEEFMKILTQILSEIKTRSNI